MMYAIFPKYNYNRQNIHLTKSLKRMNVKIRTKLFDQQH